MNGQLVTRYIKNWADTTEIKGCSSLQTLCRFDSDVLRSAPTFHIPKPLAFMLKKPTHIQAHLVFADTQSPN